MQKHPNIHQSIVDLIESTCVKRQRLENYLAYLKNRHLYKPEERKRIDFSFEHEDFD